MKVKEPEFDCKEHIIQSIHMWEQGGIMNTKDEWAHRSFGRVTVAASSSFISDLYDKYLLEIYLGVVNRAVSTINIAKLCLWILLVLTVILLHSRLGWSPLVAIPGAILFVVVGVLAEITTDNIKGDSRYSKIKLNNINGHLFRDKGWINGRSVVNRKTVAVLFEDEVKNDTRSGTKGVLTKRALQEIGWRITCPELDEHDIPYLEKEEWIEQCAVEALNKLAEECGEYKPLYPTQEMYTREGNKIEAERRDGLASAEHLTHIRQYLNILDDAFGEFGV